MYAQYLLVRHVNRIRIRRLKDCGKCVEYAFGPRPDVIAELEVGACNAEGKRIRTDVAVFDSRSVKVVTFEVRKTHATDPLSRAGDVPYFEVGAAHVIGKLDIGDSLPSRVVTLSCENTATRCGQCAKQKELAYLDKKLDAVKARRAADDRDYENTSDRNEFDGPFSGRERHPFR